MPKSRYHGRRSARYHRTYRSPGTDRSLATPTLSRTQHPVTQPGQPDQLVPPVLHQGQWQGPPWQGQWCQWPPWPPVHVLQGPPSIGGALEPPSVALSRPPRDRSADHGSLPLHEESDQWADPAAPADVQSLVLAPSPEDKIAAPPPSVPQEDFRAHQELPKRVASSPHLQAEAMEGPSDSLFNVLSSSAPGRVALLVHEWVANISNALWQTPASLAPISKWAECKYFVPTKGHEYLYTHLVPNSLVVESVNHRERQGQPGPAPKNKDSKRLDSFGRKLYSPASFQLRGSERCQGIVLRQASAPPRSASPQRGSEIPQSTSPQRGCEIPRSASPQRGSEIPRGASPQRGSEIPRSTSLKQGSEIPRSTSPQRGSEIPRSTSPQRGSEIPRSTSLKQGSEIPRGASPQRGSEIPRSTSPQRGSEIPRSTSPQRGSEIPRSTSPQRGSEIPRSTSLKQGSEIPRSASPQRGSEIPRSASPQRGSEIPRSASPQRAGELSQGILLRRESEPPLSASSQRGNEFCQGILLRRGSAPPRTAAPQRESELLRSVFPQQGHDLPQSASLQRGSESPRSASPQTVMELRSGKCSVQPGKLSVTASHLLASCPPKERILADRINPQELTTARGCFSQQRDSSATDQTCSQNHPQSKRPIDPD
ncbi:hypothetical protein KIL84_000392 [Mauremys mutica]|uniref:Uncharacterized protein n=1 Tax=Mauremys mutica TaxID=74926 RepID=A0A9D3XG85_9SAUR|nr:hypothetical protein KIL84_000392 [Mauremys mutica]